MSANDMTMAEWVPSIVRGDRVGEVMWDVARYCHRSIQSYNATPTSVLPRRVPAAPSLVDLVGRKYVLLDYISTHWIHHCARLPQCDISHWKIFEDLVLDRILPFTHLPWRQDGQHRTSPGSDRVNSEELLNWAAARRPFGCGGVSPISQCGCECSAIGA